MTKANISIEETDAYTIIRIPRTGYRRRTTPPSFNKSAGILSGAQEFKGKTGVETENIFKQTWADHDQEEHHRGRTSS